MTNRYKTFVNRSLIDKFVFSPFPYHDYTHSHLHSTSKGIKRTIRGPGRNILITIFLCEEQWYNARYVIMIYPATLLELYGALESHGAVNDRRFMMTVLVTLWCSNSAQSPGLVDFFCKRGWIISRAQVAWTAFLKKLSDEWLIALLRVDDWHQHLILIIFVKYRLRKHKQRRVYVWQRWRIIHAYAYIRAYIMCAGRINLPTYAGAFRRQNLLETRLPNLYHTVAPFEYFEKSMGTLCELKQITVYTVTDSK